MKDKNVLQTLFGLKKSSQTICYVRNFNIERYMGQWYEIARYDNWFERGMEQTSATYSMQSDGTIRVVNIGLSENGKWKQTIGKARFADQLMCPGKLEISFFGPFYSEYNIIELGKDYDYAVVAGRSKKYLWVLSRTTSIPKDKLEYILHKLKTLGYDLSKLKFVNQ